MKSIQKALLCAGLFLVAQSQATTISIYNSNFDAAYLDDGSSYSKVNNWNIDAGLVGVHNPTSDSFVGEEGEGVHSNTLYMIDGAKVSQTLSFKALENTNYKLTFDVGQLSDIALQNYTVAIKAGNKVLVSSDNAVTPSDPATFARASLVFNSTSTSSELLTIEVTTQGSGHAHFDNFSLSYVRDIRKEKPFLKPVAYGYNLQWDGASSGACYQSHSLTSDKTFGPYLVPLFGGCRCDDSQKVWVGSHQFIAANGRYRYKNFYQCVISSEQ